MQEARKFAVSHSSCRMHSVRDTSHLIPPNPCSLRPIHSPRIYIIEQPSPPKSYANNQRDPRKQRGRKRERTSPSGISPIISSGGDPRSCIYPSHQPTVPRTEETEENRKKKGRIWWGTYLRHQYRHPSPLRIIAIAVPLAPEDRKNLRNNPGLLCVFLALRCGEGGPGLGEVCWILWARQSAE